MAWPELFLAFVTEPGGFRKYVAVKRILPHLRANEEFLRMFLDEARVSAMRSHSNVEQVFDLGQDTHSLHLVLRDRCQALHYAHHFVSSSGTPQPVIHRGISPRNVMETYSGSTKVIDFGICKSRGSLEQTGVNRRKGSWGYTSPEQVRGTSLGGRSDLFAAGVVLYELLTGQRLLTASEDATFVCMQLGPGHRHLVFFAFAAGHDVEGGGDFSVEQLQRRRAPMRSGEVKSAVPG